MGKTKMSPIAARRIQSHADRTGKNQNFMENLKKNLYKNTMLSIKEKLKITEIIQKKIYRKRLRMF